MLDKTFEFIPNLNECENLVKNNTSFYSKEEKIGNKNIITFCYRLAKYSDFCNEGARNIRGISFEKESGKITALPFHKFFNYKENPFSEDSSIKTKEISLIRDKIDGSLIIFFMIENELYAKTKGDCFSSQAVNAMNIVNNNKNLKNEIIDKIKNNYTPMFEYISPKNRIVIEYNTEELIYLGSRNMLSGKYNFTPLENCNATEEYNIGYKLDLALNIVNNLKNKEGVVIVFSDGDMIKIKTEEYINLHKTFSAVNIYNDKFIADLIINEKIDDIKIIYADRIDVITYINDIEKVIKTAYNDIISEANLFFTENKNLNVKDFAIKAQSNLNHNLSFNLVMNLYNYGDINIKKFNENFIRNKLWI